MYWRMFGWLLLALIGIGIGVAFGASLVFVRCNLQPWHVGLSMGAMLVGGFAWAKLITPLK